MTGATAGIGRAVALAADGIEVVAQGREPARSPPRRGDHRVRRPRPVRRRRPERIGEPEEIAAVVRFLLGDAASYINRAIVIANGGEPPTLAA